MDLLSEWVMGILRWKMAGWISEFCANCANKTSHGIANVQQCCGMVKCGFGGVKQQYAKLSSSHLSALCSHCLCWLTGWPPLAG